MSGIDRQFDAAWRAASREQPPAALDASIRAAARRAVAAGPGKAKPASWWRVKTHWAPLAAAAAVGVIAVGILQIAPPEQVTPGLIADQSVSTRIAEMDSRKPSVPPPATIAASRRDSALAVDEIARERDAESASNRLEPSPAPMQSPSNATLAKKQPAVGAGAERPAERQLAVAPEPAPPTKSETALGETSAAAARGEPAQAATQARAQSAKLEKDQAASPAKLAHSEPFPAAMPPPGAGAEGRQRVPPQGAGKEAFPAGSEIGDTSPSAPSAPRPEAFPAQPQDKVAANVPRPAPPTREAPQVAGALASRTDQPPPSQAMGPSRVATADRAHAKDAAAPRPADEWIKLIRRLRAEGKTEEAAKELAAFRAAYKERADELLPVDLREAKP